MSLICNLDYNFLSQFDKDSLVQLAILLSFEKQKTTVEWYPVSIIAESKGLTMDAVRKQLQNGDFEEGIDFKKPNGRILVNQGAIERIHRKRRNSNGCVL